MYSKYALHSALRYNLDTECGLSDYPDQYVSSYSTTNSINPKLTCLRAELKVFEPLQRRNTRRSFARVRLRN
jgi:hypothetical protein